VADKSVSIHLKAIDEASKVFERAANNTLPAFAKRMAGLAAGFISINAGVDILKSAFNAALEAEKATSALAAALRAQGIDVARTLPGLKAHAEALARMSLADDEAIQGAQKVLVTVGGLMGTKLDEATQAALDLSAGLGIDLVDAATKIAKAANGSTKEFTRLGVEFRKGADDAEKLNTVLGFVEQRFGGMAAAEIKTASGQLHELSEAYGELLETLGTQSISAVSNVTALTKALQDLNDQATKPRTAGFVPSVALLGGAAAAQQIVSPGGFKIVEAAMAIIAMDTAKAAKETKQLADNMAEDRMENPMIGFSDAAAAAAANVKKLNTEVQALTEEGSFVAPLPASGARPFDSAFDPVTSQAMADIIDPNQLEMFNRKLNTMPDALALIADGFLQMGDSIDNATEKTVTFGAEMEQTLNQGVANAAANVGSLMVDAAFGAEIAWGEAIKNIIQGLVQMIVQAVIFKAVMGALTGGAGWFASGGGMAPSSASMMAGGGLAPAYAGGGMFIPRGTDTVPAMLTPGEAVLTRGVTHAILGGRASVVPSGSAGRSVNLTINAMDGQSVYRVLTQNPRALADALDYLDARGV
jgi:hypothetical protein